MSEYADSFCPDCGGFINDYGFCEDCGFDFEEHLTGTERDWPKSWGGAMLRAAQKGQKSDRSKKTTDSDAGNGSSKQSTERPKGGESDGWLDLYRENQQP